MADAQKLNEKINEYLFHLHGNEFIRNTRINLGTSEKVCDFLTNFMLVECVSGVDYSDDELLETFTEIQRMMEKGVPIYSEDLPVLPPKRQEQKTLTEVNYFLEEGECFYKKI